MTMTRKQVLKKLKESIGNGGAVVGDFGGVPSLGDRMVYPGIMIDNDGNITYFDDYPNKNTHQNPAPLSKIKKFIKQCP